MNVVDKWWAIVNHKALVVDGWYVVIELMPMMVNPEINAVDTVNRELNTKVEWWVELAIPIPEDEREFGCDYSHDTDLDTGGDSVDEAIDNVYDLVIEKYGSAF